LQELYNWPQLAFNKLTDPDTAHGLDCSRMLRDHFCSGVDLKSYYSGKGTAESALAYVGKVIDQELKSSANGAPCDHTGFWCSHACDNHSACQSVLTNLDSSMRPQHVFGDIHDRLPTAVNAKLTSQEPSPKASLDERLDANEIIRQTVFAGRSGYYNEEASAFCFVHGKECKLWATRAHVGGHPLVLVIAGFSCTDFCKRRHGKKPGFAGKTARSFWEFLAEILELKPDIVLYENSESFPVSVFDEYAGDQYRHENINIGPDVLGWPLSRPRKFGALFKVATVYFIGSAAEFLSIFLCSCELYADAFFQAPEIESSLCMVQRARARGYTVTENTGVSLEMLLTPSMMDRLSDYDAIRPARQALNGTFVCDLEQNSDFANSGGFLPSTPTHGTLYNFKDNRIMIGKELLAAMGDSTYLYGIRHLFSGTQRIRTHT
jgi:hypothetical protein